MSFKECKKCGESVDAAKAFCPECGDPFFEEETRAESSEFDKYAGTMNITKSMYNMMLSEMDLDTSRPAKKKPAPPAVIESQPAPVTEPVKTDPPVHQHPPIQNARSGAGKLIIAVLIGAVILIPVVAITLYLVFYFTIT